MKIPTLFILLFLLINSSNAIRDPKRSDTDPGTFFTPSSGYGFNIPGYGVPGSKGWGGGYGAGYGGPGGGYAHGGVVQPSVVCTERGACYKKKLMCPAKCFSSYSRKGKNYGAGGGGGGCTLDCKKCVAYC